MRSKLYLGLFLAGIVGIVAGDYVFNRSAGAQDAPKKVEPETKENALFEALKKSFEGKKEGGQVPPPSDLSPLTIPPPTAVKDDPKPLPTVPLPTKKEPIIPPPSVPQVVDTPKPIAPVPPRVEVQEKPAPQRIEFPPLQSQKPAAIDPVPPVIGKPPIVDAQPAQDKSIDPPGYPNQAFDKPEELAKPKKADNAPVTPAANITQAVEIGKTSPWSLHVEMLDSQTIVTATVNKKHEFKIVCQSLDLQTGKGTLKATGKVQISGDMMNGNCEHLAIGLHEDRLVLEGGAIVSIQKVTTNVSDAKPASFELKGDKLDLRISELQAGKLQQAGWHKDVGSNVRTASMAFTGKEWTTYGILTKDESQVDRAGEPVWALADRTGGFFVFLVARDGGSLAQYEGRRVSVFGATEQIKGVSFLRVTHIALP